MRIRRGLSDLLYQFALIRAMKSIGELQVVMGCGIRGFFGVNLLGAARFV